MSKVKVIGFAILLINSSLLIFIEVTAPNIFLARIISFINFIFGLFLILFVDQWKGGGLEKKESESKLLEHKLKASLERYQSLFDKSSVGMAILSLDGHFQEVNSSICSILGLRKEQFIGKQFCDFLFPDEKNQDLFSSDDVLQASFKVDLERVLLSVSGKKITLSIKNVLQRDDFGQAIKVHMLVQDISKQKEINEKQEKEAELLMHSQKMESLGTLVSGIALDFNNIFHGIFLTVYLVEKQLEDMGIQLKPMKNILKFSHRGKKLVEEILIFSRPKDKDFQSINVEESLSEIIPLLFSKKNEKPYFKISIVSESPYIKGNKTQLNQAFKNILENIRSSAEKKRRPIEVIVEEAYLNQEASKSYGLKSQNYLKIRIKNEDKGVSKQWGSKIFEPFFSNKNSEDDFQMGMGMGMGMAVADSVIKGHGGLIEVQRNENIGMEFTIYLPQNITEKDSTLNILKKDPSLYSQKRILVVEDDQLILNILTRSLQDQGHETISCTNAENALRIFKKKPMEIDAIITDLGMPGMNGADLCREVLKLRNSIPIIMTTGYGVDESVSRLEERTNFIRIDKPYGQEVIFEVLDRALKFQELSRPLLN